MSVRKSRGGMTVPIGILGSIFDPVHYGHLAAAALAGDYFHLDSVIYIPAGVPPHKRSTVQASPSDRLAMLRLALEGDSRAVIWDREVFNTGISYTVDTLEQLVVEYPGSAVHFIVGADNLHEIHTWYRYREILDRVTLCVAERPGFSTTVPDMLTGARVETFPSPLWGLSSSQLRSYLSNGYRCRHLLPERVREYIFQRGLYHEGGGCSTAVHYRQVH